MRISASSTANRRFRLVAMTLLAAGILVLQLGVPALASGPNGAIQGYALDGSSGLPVEGALVRIEPDGLPWVYEIMTDASGYFEASVVPQRYNLIVLHGDYRFFQVQVDVGSLETRWVNASLDAASPRSASVRGYVTDSVTTDPVTVGRVVAIPILPPFEYVNVSNLDPTTGFYAIGLVPGDYQLFTDSTIGYFGFATSVSVADGEVLWLNVTVDPNPFDSSVTGVVYDASTLSPIVGAIVSVDVDDLFLPNVTTDGSGAYTIPVPAGSATVTGNALGYGPDTEFVSVAPMTTYPLDLFLRPILGSIRGYVSDSGTALPVPNATVSASDFDGYFDERVTDGSGHYEIPVPAGSLTLEGSASGYLPYGADLFLTEGEILWWNFSMVPIPPIVATVQGYVIDASSGSHVPSMTVAVFDVFSGFSNVTLADVTGFYALGVVESAVLIALVPAGGGYAGGQTFTSASAGDVVWANITIYPLNATVRVHVTDALTGLPISGAFASLSWGFTYFATNGTDAGGNADMLSPATMDVDLFVSAGGYYTDSRTMTVAPALNAVDIALYPMLPFDVLVRGYITENGTGTPIAGAQVEASGYPFSTIWNFTDSSGYVELWIVAQPQIVRATQPGYASNETSVSPGSGDIVWVNLTLDFDPVPPRFVAFTATPDVGVNPANPTALVADILEKKLDPQNTAMTLLRLMNATGPNGTFLGIGPVDPADLVISQPASGEYTVSTTWDSRSVGGWIQNGSASEWWPSTPGFFPETDGVFGYWFNGTIPSPDLSLALFNRASGDLALVFSFTYGIIAPADQPTSTFTPAGSGLVIDLGTGQILGPAPILGAAFELAGLRFAYDEVVPSGGYAAFLEATDTAGNWNYSVAFFEVDVPPPVANAGPDQTVDEDTTVTFDGSGSSDNAGIDDCTWTFTDGTAQTLSGSSPTYVFANPGIYVVTLTVRDAGGSSATDTLTVTVLDVTAPAANAGLDQTVDEDTPVTFDGSGSTDNVGVVNYTWTFSDGGPVALYGSSPSYVFASPGTYVVSLTTVDAAGNSGTDSMTVIVLDVTPPVPNAGPDQTVDEDTTVTFDGSSSTDNVGVANYTWTFVDGGPRTLYGSTPSYVFGAPGSYAVTLTASDGAGNLAADTLSVTVRDVTPPAANAGPDQTVDEDTTVTFDGTGSSDNVGVANYTWALTDGVARTLYGVSTTYVFATPGSYSVTLTVRDAAGASSTDTLAVTVRDVTDPTVAMGTPAAGATLSGLITVDATAADNVGVVRVELRVDGILVATDSSSPYAFALNTANYSDGSHTVRVTAFDAAGNSVSAERTVTFSNPLPQQGLGLEGYAAILLVAVAAVSLLAWMLLRRRRGPPPAEREQPAETQDRSSGRPPTEDSNPPRDDL